MHCVVVTFYVMLILCFRFPEWQTRNKEIELWGYSVCI